MFAIVVDIPAINGKAPQTPQPIAPKKNNFLNSLFNLFFFLNISFLKKGNKIINTVNHLQNAKEIGGTYSTPPLATIIFVAIKIGCTKSKIYGKSLFFCEVKTSNYIIIYHQKLHSTSCLALYP